MSEFFHLFMTNAEFFGWTVVIVLIGGPMFFFLFYSFYLGLKSTDPYEYEDDDDYSGD